MDYFKNRRTIRRYSDRKLTDAEIESMLEQAMHAPTCGSMQLYSVVISRSDAEKQALAPAHFNQPSVTGAQAVITFCADFNRFTQWCRLRGADPGYDNVQSFISAALDTVILAQQFVTIAEMNGLGICYLGTTTWNAPQIIDTLGLPELVVPVITVTVGYPGENPDLQPRLPHRSLIHYGRYTPCDAESIGQCYDDFESLGQNRKFTAENGKETLAQVFTDVRYTRQANEHFSEIFIGVLKKAKFLNTQQ
ncbi:MAG: nitroreductase family protein [Muribaculaceae bacterium]|nr:nitroreductase family protein [Muribaculaceae bacterium]